MLLELNRFLLCTQIDQESQSPESASYSINQPDGAECFLYKSDAKAKSEN